jgi:hypothetical protein
LFHPSFVTIITPVIAHKIPSAAPARTSSGQCTPTAILDIPTKHARITRQSLERNDLKWNIRIPASVKIVTACPDGKE